MPVNQPLVKTMCSRELKKLFNSPSVALGWFGTLLVPYTAIKLVRLLNILTGFIAWIDSKSLNAYRLNAANFLTWRRYKFASK